MSFIHDRVYLGSYEEVKSYKWLKSHGVTHILNCAREIPDIYPASFLYMDLNLDDAPEQDISDALIVSHLFIEWALRNDPKAVVFVHCMMGISRSSTMVINHILKLNVASTYEDAYRFVRKQRDIIHPNSGFVKQLKKVYPSKGSPDVPFSEV